MCACILMKSKAKWLNMNSLTQCLMFTLLARGWKKYILNKNSIFNLKNSIDNFFFNLKSKLKIKFLINTFWIKKFATSWNPQALHKKTIYSATSFASLQPLYSYTTLCCWTFHFKHSAIYVHKHTNHVLP